MSWHRPIGVFDSGVGGLTVLKSLREAFPNENFVYLGDTAHVPYGTKSDQSILRLLNTHLDFFKSQGVKSLVLACNTASTLMDRLPKVDFPIFGVIKPGAKLAALRSTTKKIGVIAT